jgi:hypothetical protein
MAAKANVAKSGSGMDIDTQSPYPAFAVQDGYMSERFSVLQRRCKVQVAGQQNKALCIYVEVPDIAGLLRINNVPVRLVDTQMRGQMHVNAVCPHAVPENGFYYDVPLVEGVNKILFCQYHVLGFLPPSRESNPDAQGSLYG